MKSTQDLTTHERVIASLAADAQAATTPDEAFRVAILAVHYSRVIDAGVDTAYSGARLARTTLEQVAGQNLGDPR